MDFVVTPGSRIDKLPRKFRIPALVLRNARDLGKRTLSTLVFRPMYGFVYNSDGLATKHYSPFMTDRAFSEAYERMATWWWQGRQIDVRWRMWMLTRAAAQCKHLPGAFVEFGVYRAGCAFMIMTLGGLGEGEQFYLFDTFEGIPDSNLSPGERDAGFGGRLADTSLAHVQKVLSPWSKSMVTVPGDIFDTLEETETGSVALCHLDLNASAPTLRALEYIYPRLLPSAIVIMDDYGQTEYQEQRRIIDRFFADKPEVPIALPTGQGLVIKI